MKISVQIIIDTDEKKATIASSTNRIDQQTLDVLAEGLLWVFKALKGVGDTPAMFQKRWDRLKQRVWTAVLEHWDDDSFQTQLGTVGEIKQDENAK